jgi:Domain of unknown function (DUF4136)
MKLIHLLLSIGLSILLLACSEQIRVKSDYDRDINFSGYKSYGWLPTKEIEVRNNPLIYNELTDKRIKKAVDGQLPSKGLRSEEVNPDLRVHYHIVIDNKSALQPEPYGYHYSPYWVRTRMDVYQYREGTLIVDFMDSKSNNLVWRGWASSVLEVDEIDLSEGKINEAINKILMEYPPVKK